MTSWRVGSISPTPSPQEVAAITAALAVIESEQAAAAAAAARAVPDHLAEWVAASRRSAQRASLQRGPWRLSGRIGRRFRA